MARSAPKANGFWEYCVNRFQLPRAIKSVHQSCPIDCCAVPLRLAHGKDPRSWAKDSMLVSGATLVVVWKRWVSMAPKARKSRAVQAA